MTLSIRTGLSALDSDDKDSVRSTGVLVHVGAAKVQGDKKKPLRMKPLPHRSVGVTSSHDFLNRIDGVGDERLEILDVNTRVGPLFQLQLFADVFT